MAVNIFPAPSTGPEQYNFAVRGNDRNITLAVPSGYYNLTVRAESPFFGMSPLTVDGTTLNAGTYTQNVTSGQVVVRRTLLGAFSERNAFSGGSGAFLGSAWGNGLHVLVGAAGRVTRSTDSFNWTTTTATSTTWNAVTFGNGTFVIGGTNGNMMTTPDATTFTLRSPGAGVVTNALTFGNGLFVAGGNNGVIYTSQDGITWTSRTSGFGSTPIRGLTFGGGLFVAVGDTGIISTSPDGITWTVRKTGGSALNSVAFGNGLYAAVGSFSLFTSPDAITWTDLSATPGPGMNSATWRSITFGPGGFIAVGDSDPAPRIAASGDGVTWFSIGIATNNNRLRTIHFGNIYYVLAGDGGYVFAREAADGSAPVVSYVRIPNILTV
jgi:hypothetical protein